MSKELELELDTEVSLEVEEKGPTKKDLAVMEKVYADILKPESVDFSGLEGLSKEDKIGVVRISKYIDECIEANRINSKEYVRVEEDEDVKEISEMDLEDFSNVREGMFD